MPADLWAARCDANQLESAILNLAINARDAMPNGGKLQIKAANVTVADEPRSKQGISSGQYVTLAVLDSGAGMNADIVSRAFEPFSRQSRLAREPASGCQ
jgi:signal transduction histidine kinase